MTETPLNMPSKIKKPVEINSISSSDKNEPGVPKDKFERIFYKRQKAEDLARRKELKQQILELKSKLERTNNMKDVEKIHDQLVGLENEKEKIEARYG
jgi:predicted ATPase